LVSVLCVVGYKDVGKTTVMEGLIKAFTERGLRVGTVKHHGGGGSFEPPLVDTARHRRAGAACSLVSSRHGWSLVVEEEWPLERLLELVGALGVDLVLVEGYKRAPYPKVEVVGPDGRRACLGDPHLLAVIGPATAEVPRFDRDEVGKLASYVLERVT